MKQLLVILFLVVVRDTISFSMSSFGVAPTSGQWKSGFRPVQASRLIVNFTLFSRQNDSDDSSRIASPLDRPLLALVDTASLLTFASVGKASHATDGSIDLLATGAVAFPFLTAWFLTSPLTGVYTPDQRGSNLIFDTFVKSGKGWIVAIPLGCVVRGIIKGYVPPFSFVIVTMIATFFILGFGRLIYAALETFFVELVN